MSSPALIALREELEAAKALLLPQLEGLRDFARLNLITESLTAVQAATVDFERRLTLVEGAISALDGLAADGYPEVPQRDVLQTVYADLQVNVTTIQAAFAKFSAVPEATEAVIVPGQPEERP